VNKERGVARGCEGKSQRLPSIIVTNEGADREVKRENYRRGFQDIGHNRQEWKDDRLTDKLDDLGKNRALGERKGVSFSVRKPPQINGDNG